MHKIMLFIALLSTLCSCAIYQQEFDSPPPNGVPNTSVTDLEAMVIETPKGPDLFLPNQKTMLSSICETFKRKVWFADECYDITQSQE